MLDLYLIRHGETVWNVEMKMQGSHDSPLTERGKEIAYKTADYLADMSFNEVYTSPLMRARITAEILSRGKAIISEDRLREMNFGALEGINMDSMKDMYPETVYNLFNKPEKYVPINGGETYDSVLARAQSFADCLAEKYGRDDEIHKVMIVTHGIMLRAFWLVFEELPVEYFRTMQHPGQCTITRALYDRRWHMVCYDNSKHLR